MTSSASSRCCRSKRQNLLFSATFSDEIRRLADTLLQPGGSRGRAPQRSAELVDQRVYIVRKEAASATCWRA
jgi:ATP-dependent RNA helicase RhlE